MLKARGLATAVGDEGGFAPDLKSNEEAIETILEAIGKAGYEAGSDVYLGLDAASSEFFEDGTYHLDGEGKVLSPAAVRRVLRRLVREVPDPHASRTAWPKATGSAGSC